MVTYGSEQFIQWFIREQTEEVATMSDLLRVAERSRDDLADLEDFVAREHASAEQPRSHRAEGRRGSLTRAASSDQALEGDQDSAGERGTS